ncbi:uncharacterized protein LOC126837206 [Adelges cooleyi]|uniref:uncharacterized protein LOC126837206 n=1 Tax=Adelges cooleyi TaxID=133065 RepID=UPI00217F8835|nr:uncharacterized protein LOC126837206 [Adelges cooleyi]
MARRNQLGSAVVAAAAKKKRLPSRAWKMSTDVQEIETARDVRYKLECPICYSVQYPMTHACPMNHVVCVACFRHMRNNRCPVCRAYRVKRQPVSLNKTLEFRRVTCRHHADGCRVLVRVANLGQHEARCMYKPVCCVYPGCRWTDPVCDNLRDHVTHKHPGITVRATVSVVVYVC